MGILTELSRAWSYLTKPSPMGRWVDAVSASIDSGSTGVVYAPATPSVWNPVPTTVAGALDELATERTTLVFRPSEPNPVGNLFATWPALYAASLATRGPKTIIFDDTLAACNIPVGAYDFGPGCMFLGVIPALNSVSSNRVEVTCPQGVTFTTPLLSINEIRLSYTGAAALMTIPGTGKVFNFYMRGQARTNSSGGGRIFDIGPAAILVINMFDNSAHATGLFTNVTDVTATLNILAVESGVVNQVVPVNTLAGVAGATYGFQASRQNLFQAGTAVAPQSQQAGMPGGVITLGPYSMGAPNLAYFAAVGANWVDPDPTTVQAAIDRIAARLVTVGAGPIP